MHAWQARSIKRVLEGIFYALSKWETTKNAWEREWEHKWEWIELSIWKKNEQLGHIHQLYQDIVQALQRWEHRIPSTLSIPKYQSSLICFSVIFVGSHKINRSSRRVRKICEDSFWFQGISTDSKKFGQKTSENRLAKQKPLLGWIITKWTGNTNKYSYVEINSIWRQSDRRWNMYIGNP